MPETSMLTIVFRGLMVFRANAEADQMEIGILRAAGHIPRILTIRNSILFAVDLLQPESLNDARKPIWELKVTDPARPGVRTYQGGSPTFERRTHGDDRDFRWIMDLEGAEFYGRDLSAEMTTKKLMPIIHVPHGEFYTRLKSPVLNRQEGTDQPSEFGAVAAAIGCDIQLNGGGAELSVVSGDPIFTFANEPNTIYEITNTPPDVQSSVGSGAAHHDGGHGPAPVSGPGSHFQHYYDLFPHEFTPRFNLQPLKASRAPDPALCGSVGLGGRAKPLGQDTDL